MAATLVSPLPTAALTRRAPGAAGAAILLAMAAALTGIVVALLVPKPAPAPPGSLLAPTPTVPVAH